MPNKPDVLIVDDEPEIVDLICEVLGDEGYDVRVAPNGAEALAVIEERRPALVLVDYTMPGLSGSAFLQLIRTRGYADLPVVVMSAHARLAAAELVGASEFLSKPFDLDTLLACVGRYTQPCA